MQHAIRKALWPAMIVILTACGKQGEMARPVVLEIRPASTTPGPGLRTMQTANETLYIADELLIANSDVQEAHVVSTQDGHQVEIALTEAGSTRFAAATERYRGKRLAIIIDDTVSSAPVVWETITNSRVTLGSSFSEAEAKRIAAGIGHH